MTVKVIPKKKVLVKNAASERQVKKAKNYAALQEKEILSAFRAVLATPAGVKILWYILGHCGSFRSIWEPSAKIHYNAGRQDVGHWLMARITDADKMALIKIMKKNAEETEGANE